MSQSKIKAIVPGKPWTAKTGEQMFSYKVTLEDGVFGDANSKSNPPPWGVGDAVEYTSEPGKFGNKLKLKKAGFGQTAPAAQQQAGNTAPNHSATSASEGMRVGCAMRSAAVIMAGKDITTDAGRKAFWQTASVIYTCAEAMEHGKIWGKNQAATPPPHVAVTDKQLANQDDGPELEDDVPF